MDVHSPLYLLTLSDRFSNKNTHCIPKYRGRPIMNGTSVIKGTKYAWNADYKGGHICLEH